MCLHLCLRLREKIAAEFRWTFLIWGTEKGCVFEESQI